jgi:hypothetical protein
MEVFEIKLLLEKNSFCNRAFESFANQVLEVPFEIIIFP